MTKSSKYFVAMENISFTVGGSGNTRDPNIKTILFKKGEIGEFVEPSTINGYFRAKRLNSDDVFDIPYAPAFIKFIGDDLSTVQTLYGESDEEIEIEL